MGGSGIREPDYPGTIRYVLRRRDRSGFWTAIFLFAFSAALLTVATVSVATGNTPGAGVWDFLLFGLLAAACGIFELRDHAAILGQVLMAVGDAGIYLTEPPRCVPWSEVAGVVVFRIWQDGDDADSGEWLSQVAVVPSGGDFLPGAGAWCLPSPDQRGVTVDLHDDRVRLGELSDAVHTYAPGLPVWDAGKIKSKNVRVEGRQQTPFSGPGGRSARSPTGRRLFRLNALGSYPAGAEHPALRHQGGDADGSSGCAGGSGLFALGERSWGSTRGMGAD